MRRSRFADCFQGQRQADKRRDGMEDWRETWQRSSSTVSSSHLLCRDMHCGVAGMRQNAAAEWTCRKQTTWRISMSN